MTASVLHLANHCDRGGNVHLAVDLACAQGERGERVAFASAGGRNEALLAQCGVRHVLLDQSLRRPYGALRAIRGLIALCRQLRPDVLHAHMMSGAVLGRTAGTALGIPLVTTVHNSFDRHAWLMRLGDRIIAVSRAERDLLLERGFPKRRLAVVVNGTLGSARSAAQTGSAGCLPRPSIVTMSGLERRKGVHDVIEAFAGAAAAAPRWFLVVAGEGPERDALEQQAAGTGLGDRIRFIGHVENPRDLLRQAEIFVSAPYAEPFGLGVLEAREAGCAVIGSRVGGIAEQLGPELHGRTVPAGRPDILAGELRRLMTDPAALADARDRARRGLDYYGIDRMAEEYEAIYDALLDERRICFSQRSMRRPVSG